MEDDSTDLPQRKSTLCYRYQVGHTGEIVSYHAKKLEATRAALSLAGRLEKEALPPSEMVAYVYDRCARIGKIPVRYFTSKGLLPYALARKVGLDADIKKH